MVLHAVVLHTPSRLVACTANRALHCRARLNRSSPPHPPQQTCPQLTATLPAGPTVEPAEALTCTPIAPAPLTDIIGTATWACSTGGTNMTDVTISVEAPNPYSSE